MKTKSRLCHTFITVVSQVEKWLDVRPMKTLTWMVEGVLETEKIELTS